MKRWCEHDTEALNHPADSQSQELDDAYSPAIDDPDLLTDISAVTGLTNIDDIINS